MKKPLIHTLALGLTLTLGLGVATSFAATSHPLVETHAAYTVLEYVDFARLYNAPWQGNNRNVDLTGSQDNTPWLRASGWGASTADLKANEVILGNYGARLWYTGGYVTFSVNLTAESELDDVYFLEQTYMGSNKIPISYTVSSGKYVYSHTYTMGNSNLKPYFHMDGENKKVTDFHFYVLAGNASASSFVQLNRNGGSGGTEYVEAAWNSAMPAITKPTRNGYVFDGYYDAPSGGNKYYNADGSSARTYKNGDATTLYAHWAEAKYTVTLNKNGGTGGTNSVVATKGSAMPTLSSLPTRAGYTFAGYYSATSGGTKYYNANGTSAKNFDKDANTTLYAQWTAIQYTVTYNANGGSVSPASFTYKTNKNTTTSTAQNFTLATPTRTGYTFAGWTTSKSGTSISNKTALTINGNIYGNFTVTASWTAIPYTISYDLAGGTVSGTNPTQYTIETATFTLVNPTKVGYDFVGWTGSNGNTPQTSVSIAKGSTGNKNYTANWVYNAAVQSFIDKVNAIGEVSYGGSGASKAAIADAFAAYALLSDGEKALTEVANLYAALQDAQTEYDAQKAAAIGDYVAKVNALKDQAENDPDNVEYTATYETLLKDVRDAYAGLEAAEHGDTDVVAAHDAYVPYQEKYDSLIESAQQAFIAKVNAIKEAAEGDYANVAYTETFRALIGNAKEAYAAIREADRGDTDVVTKKGELDTAESIYLAAAAAYAASVKSLIDAIEPITADTAVSDAAIAAARDGYNALFDEQKNDPSFIAANIPNYQRLLDAEAANPIAKQILAIGASTESGFAEKVAAAQTAYNALTADQKALISGAVAGILSDDVAALSVMDLIDAIGEVAYTGECKGKIDAARSAYDALTPAQKALVANLGVLTKAETDYAAVKAVVDEVNAIGDITYDDASEGKIDSARGHYEALSDDQKAFFPEATLTLLENYEDAYAVMGQIVAIGEVENTEESKALVATAKAAYDAYKEKGYETNLLDPNIAKILTNDLQIVDVMEKINAIGEVVFTPECKVLIDTAKAAYDAIGSTLQGLVPNAEVLLKAETDYYAVKAVADEIDAIGDITYDAASEGKIDSAREHYEALTDDQKAIFPLEGLENYEEAYDVMGKIAAIGEVEDTPESKALVEAAEAAYAVYKDAHEVNRLDPAYEKILLDDAAAQDVIDAINAIGELEYTPESKALIDAARDAYDALEADQKPLVANYGELTKAEADYAAVQGVANEVNAIGDITYDDASKAKIDSARADYEALSEDQKVFFPIECLENYEEAYAVMDKIAAIGEQKDTPESKALVAAAEAAYNAYRDAHEENRLDPAYEQALLDHVAAQEAIDKINAIGELEYDDACKGRIDDAREYYDALTDAQKANVANYGELTKAEADYAAVDAVAKEVRAIGDIAYDAASKAKIDAAREHYEALSEDQKAFFPIAELEAYEAAYDEMGRIVAIGELEYNEACKGRIDDARTHYDALTDAQKAYVSNYDVLTKAEADFAAVDAVAKEVQAIGDITYDDASKAKIDSAREHYEALADDQKAFFPIEWLENYEAAYAEMGEIDAIGTLVNTPESKALVEAAKSGYDALSEAQKDLLDPAYEKTLLDDYAAMLVMEEINAIGELEYTPESKALIDAARAAYDALEEDQKPLVPNYASLTKAEADYAAVKAVAEEIAAIGDITYDEASKGKIDAAREHYEALSDDQKAFFPKATLTALENYEDAYATLGKIYAIGEVGYDSDSEQRIEEARAAYDSLSEAQKALINQRDFSRLLKGEDSLREQKTNGTILSSVLLGVSCLALVGGIVFLALLLKKKKGSGGERVKSILPLPLVVLASYYLGAPFIALYVIAGLTVAVWIAVLVIVLRRKHGKKAAAVEEGGMAAEPKPERPSEQPEAQPSPAVAHEAVEVLAEEGEEGPVVVKDAQGNVFQIRYERSFTAKMCQAEDEVKSYYRTIKNHALSYKKANSRISWYFDSVNVGRAQALKFAVKGKTLCVYLALDPESLDPKYRVEKVEGAKYENVPCLYRIRNDRRCKYALELIDMVMQQLGVEPGKVVDEDYDFPYESTEALVAKGLIKERRVLQEESNPVVLADAVEAAPVEGSEGEQDRGFEVRFDRSFTARMCQCGDEPKAYYRAIKNRALSFKKARSRISWSFDAINVGRAQALKFAVKGKTLCLYLALDPESLDPKYRVEKVEGAKYEGIRCLYRIRNDRRCKYALELIGMVMERLGAEPGKEVDEDYDFPYASTEALVEQGLIKARRK